MIKKFFLVILGIVILAAGAVAVHLPSRHFAYQVFYGIKLYQNLAEKYKADPSCKSEYDIQLCLTKIINESGGFKFGTDMGVAMGLLISNKVAFDTFIRGNIVLVTSVEPEKFWIRGVKGKAAKRLFKKEKKDLMESLMANRNQMATAILEKRHPASEPDIQTLIEVLDRKIVELSK